MPVRSCLLASIGSSDLPHQTCGLSVARGPVCVLGGGMAGAGMHVAITVHVCVPGEGAYVISRCLAGVRSPVLHNPPGSLPTPCPHSLRQTGVK